MGGRLILEVWHSSLRFSRSRFGTRSQRCDKVVASTSSRWSPTRLRSASQFFGTQPPKTNRWIPPSSVEGGLKKVTPFKCGHFWYLRKISGVYTQGFWKPKKYSKKGEPGSASKKNYIFRIFSSNSVVTIPQSQSCYESSQSGHPLTPQDFHLSHLSRCASLARRQCQDPSIHKRRRWSPVKDKERPSAICKQKYLKLPWFCGWESNKGKHSKSQKVWLRIQYFFRPTLGVVVEICWWLDCRTRACASECNEAMTGDQPLLVFSSCPTSACPPSKKGRLSFYHQP